MKIYQVGGAVRDRLLGLPVKDHDYVVVGATPEQMVALGYRPVGKDFPVFLHPSTNEEYALARTERKTAPGYTGFVFHTAADVTLEQDLARRDLTINAIAEDDHGVLIDPFHGVADLRAGVLRHVSSAFVEDPVRILRLARFAARFGFTVADETQRLMRDMVRSGEVDALVPERVWQELAKGLMEAQPSRMLLVLRECGALARILPEVERLFGVPQPVEHHPEIDTGDHVMRVLDYAASESAPLEVRFAALAHDLGKGNTSAAEWPHHYGHEARGVALVEALCNRVRVPNDCRDLARLVARFHGDIHRAEQLRPQTILKLLQSCDAFRKPDRFGLVLQACRADSRGRLGWEARPYPQAARLQLALAAACGVDAGAVAMACDDKRKIPERVAAARLDAIRQALGDPR
ncbi:multifunctional CCA addition/repair protein [Chitinivorax sp. PXF-14]|uniref:multifunctional CCA addition/repair protein n=1 Tax=Chitinivorax sp. PXF-14 TaxID=3230488 RepID=UPI003465E8BB